MPEGTSRVDRILEWADADDERLLDRAAQALQADGGDGDFDGEQLDRADRAALRRVGGLRTELEDVTEVEYRELRLENVVLVGVHAGKVEDAENSIR